MYCNKLISKLNKFPHIKLISQIDEKLKSSDKVILKCCVHNITKEYIASDIVNSKYICRECSIEGQKKQQQMNSYSKFIEKSKNKFGNKFEYLDFDESKYENNHSRVKLICSIHGEFICEPTSHLRSNVGACPRCVEETKLNKLKSKGFSISNINKNNWLKLFHEKHGNKYDYSEFKYISKNRKSTIICPTHGKFEQSPNEHLKSKIPCKKCRDLKNNEHLKMDQDKFIELSKKIFPEYDYSRVKYVNNETKVEIICPKHSSFYIRPKQLIHYNQGCSKCTTKTQTLINNEIQKIGVQTEFNNRKILEGKEIDIFIPEHNLGIEYNGLLFHSFGKTYPNNFDTINPKNDLNKLNIANKKNIQILFIWENEWNNLIKREIWLSVIKNKLNLISRDNTIYARNCDIQQVSIDEAKEFLNYNHLQGYATAPIRLGLYYQDELVSLMTFSKPRFNKNAEYELIRFASKVNHRVIGAASKLLKYFERNFKPKSVISYANKRWSNGILYEKLGFQKIDDSSPNYFYIDSSGKLYSRTSFQKHTLKNKLRKFDPNLSEVENMINNGYRIIYDCGNYVYLKRYKSTDE